MFRIAVCDDDKQHLKMIGQKLLALADRLKTEFLCDSYHDGQEILDACEALKPNYYQIMIFDIQMQVMSGIEAAHNLREHGWNRTKFIFVSSYDSYFQQLCSVEACAFVDKARLEQEFEDTFLKIYTRLFRDNQQLFVYTQNKVNKAIALREIAYFENKGHNVIIHKMDGETISIYRTLPKIVEDLQEAQFIMPQKSFYVNILFVESLSNDKIYLKDGTVKVLGRQYKKDALQKYHTIVRGWRPL